jgi:tRNA pseudouridine55 synthase
MAAGPEGLAVLDKPAGWTSHDVVAKVRRLLGTRRVGHAGTLDPMATGVLLVGVGRATRLLGYLSAADKSYTATVRLGEVTDTDDADGTVIATSDASAVTRTVVERAAAALVGEIEQVPPAYSAVKVAGRRSYARARAGEEVALPPRRVVVHRLTVVELGPPGPVVDVRVEVDCSSGTYIRSLARDLGAALHVGAHLVRLRRIRIGAFDQDSAQPLPERGELLRLTGVGDLVRAVLGELVVDAEQAAALAHGRRVPADGPDRTVGAFGPEGLVAVVAVESGRARPRIVFADSGTL